MPEPIPLGLTFFEARLRAIVRASFVNNDCGGDVELVFTSLTHFFIADIWPPPSADSSFTRVVFDDHFKNVIAHFFEQPGVLLLQLS